MATSLGIVDGDLVNPVLPALPALPALPGIPGFPTAPVSVPLPNTPEGNVVAPPAVVAPQPPAVVAPQPPAVVAPPPPEPTLWDSYEGILISTLGICAIIYLVKHHSERSR